MSPLNVLRASSVSSMSRGVLPDRRPGSRSPPPRAPALASRAMPPRRRAALAAAGAGALAAAVAWRALWYEPRTDRVRQRELELPRWPAELDGLRVALISDLHAGAPHVDEERLERLVAAVNADGPDLVLLLGDFVDPNVRGATPVAPEAVAGRLGALRARHGVFAVLGNHDWL